MVSSSQNVYAIYWWVLVLIAVFIIVFLKLENGPYTRIKHPATKISNIINTISLIHEYKGKQDLYIETKKDSLTNLLNIAKIQSTEYSNKIGGFYGV
mgnify:CR=1 FL=1